MTYQPMIPTPIHPDFRAKLIRLTRSASQQSDRVYSGRSCTSDQTDAGWQAEKWATRAMSYRQILMGLDWEAKALERLTKMAEKINTNGSATIAQTSYQLASKHFQEHTIHSKAPKVTTNHIQDELKAIANSL